ncbi:transcription factor IIIB 50 kDa subunit isoform X2 [Neopelma chrysocephalum]|uniref:transcription factor IIIB 50 kDa subunit isoform X2 n=1 Tax=Neopelma chrysocephalum TaxID=114329 RepID=UPI000FCD4232|nr:transcription factor IIIB 50 kDa subunit isoform X2 [Neopelma chrysocephalum]
MAARGRCPECGSAALVEDALYAQQQLVCAACGCVLAEGLLTTTYSDEEHLREVAYSQSTGQKERLSRCLQRGIRRVQDLCKVLQLPAVFEKTAVSYFQRALQLPAFHLVSLEKKELLGGCCVFVTCRQHNWPLTMGTICSLLYAKQDLFAGVFLSLQKELGLSVPALSLADLVKTHLSSFRLFQPSADVPAPFLEDKEKLVARTMGIVELASETWLVTGRHPVPVVTAAAFLAWQSLQPRARLSCPLARFCRVAGVDLPPPAQLRLKELLEILLGMASQLAWLRGFRLDKKTVVKHVGDLLQHRVFLLKNAFCQEGGEEQQCGAASGQGSTGQGSPGEGTPGQHSLDKDAPGQDSLEKGSPGQDSLDKDAPGQDSLDKDAPGQDSLDKGSAGQDSLDKGAPGQDSLGQGSPSSPLVAQEKGCPLPGKFPRPLLPPCLIHPRKKLRSAAPSAPDPAVTGDEPISDSEIEQYLRSPEEIRAFRKAKDWS